MKKIVIGTCAALLGMVGCARQESASTEVPIRLESNVRRAMLGKAPVEGSASFQVQIGGWECALDAQTLPNDPMWTSTAAVQADAHNAELVFAPARSYKAGYSTTVRLWYPQGTVAQNQVMFANPLADLDVLCSQFEVGTAPQPITRSLECGHLTTQLQFEVVGADWSADEPIVSVAVRSAELPIGIDLVSGTLINNAPTALLVSGVEPTVPTATATALGRPMMIAPVGQNKIYVDLTTREQVYPNIEVTTPDPTFLAGRAYRIRITLSCDGAVTGSLIVVDWHNTLVPDESIGDNVFESDYIMINGLYWTKGNLVADGAHGCKVGAPVDGGLYFQFGSLIGYKGGDPINGGTGVGTLTRSPDTFWGDSYSWASEAMVWPSEMSTTPSAWPRHNGLSAGDMNTVVNQWFFSYNTAPYSNDSQDIRGFNTAFSGDANTGNLGTGRYAKWGIGDPCTYYLGGTWRLPTTNEIVAMCNNQSGYGQNIAWESCGALWVTSPVIGGNFSSDRLFFPASGYRRGSNGSFCDVTTDGYYWSSSVYTAGGGFRLGFYRSWVYPQHYYGRSYGFPVRCVSSVP